MGAEKQRNGRIQVFRKSTIGRRNEAFGRRFGAEKNQKSNLIRKKSGPELDHRAPILTDWGHIFGAFEHRF